MTTDGRHPGSQGLAGPYEPYRLAQAHRVGNLVYVSGQAAGHAGRDLVAGGLDRQAGQVFTNLTRVLEAAGSSLVGLEEDHLVPAGARDGGVGDRDGLDGPFA